MKTFAKRVVKVSCLNEETQSCRKHVLEQQSPTFCHQGPVLWKTIYPQGWRDGSGGKVSSGKWWGVADEAWLALPLLTSCCVAQLLTGRGLAPVPVCGPGVGDPCLRGLTWPKGKLSVLQSFVSRSGVQLPENPKPSCQDPDFILVLLMVYN